MLTNFLKLIKGVIFLFSSYDKNSQEDSIYNLQGFDVENKRILLKIHPRNQMCIFVKPVSDVYHSMEYLCNFTKKHAALIGALYFLEQNNATENLKILWFKERQSGKYLTFFSMLFMTIMLLANIISPKIVMKYGFEFTAATLVFSFLFSLIAMITEVYGYGQARRIIWFSLFCDFLCMLTIFLTNMLPSAPYWALKTPYGIIMNSILIQILGSMLAFFCSYFLNSYLLAKMKVKFRGGHLFLRVIASSSIAIIVDSIIFCLFVYSPVLSQQTIYILIFHQIIIKIFFMVICAYLLVVPLSKFLKKAEQMDHFDIDTRFTPFSLSMET